MSLQAQLQSMHVSVPADPDAQKLTIPLFAVNPSRVVQFMNMMSAADLFDEEEIYRVKDDLVEACQEFGEIIALEIPRPTHKPNADPNQQPDEDLHEYTYGVGKLFVKFENTTSAKLARYRISGRKYNGRTVVSSFYPEHYFDIKEFSII